MKKLLLFFSLSLLSFAGFAQLETKMEERTLQSLWTSLEKESDKPFLIFADYKADVFISQWVNGSYVTVKFPHTQDLVERGYGFYNDYTFTNKGVTYNYRVLNEYDKKRKLIITASSNGIKNQREYEMKSIVN